MKPFDIFITYMSWVGGGKMRPVLAYIINYESVFTYQITTQFDNKSEEIRVQYFKINDWVQAGLNVQSYVDTGTLLKLPYLVTKNKTSIGKLTENDKQRLIDFIENR